MFHRSEIGKEMEMEEVEGKEMEEYLIRYIVKGYNWPAEEVRVSSEQAEKIMADSSLLILRMEEIQ